jgi:prepilin-type N-terminal cleavage/methylation domain-containing protein
MQKRKQQGFSLVELMIVVVIIAVFSALAIPGITRVRYRNNLSEMLNEVQQIATEARALAMQTRRAVVLEVDPNVKAWVNLLPGSSCSTMGNIAQRCVFEADLATINYDLAGATMCTGNQLLLAGDPLTCSQSSNELVYTTRYALCYSGRGELFVRNSRDANTENCAATGAPSANQVWNAVCDQLATTTPNSDTLLSGVAIPFNRYPKRDCDQVAEDVQRVLFIPTRGAPYSK